MDQPQQRKRSISDILEAGAGLAARNILVLLRITAPLTLPVSVLLAAVVVWLANSSGSKHLAIGILVPVAVVYAIAIIVSGAACFKVAAEAYNGASPSPRTEIELVLRRIVPVLLLTVLLLFGAVPAVSVLVLPGIIAVGKFGLLLLILALLSLWLLGALAVSLPAMLLEGKGIADSLRRSARLVRGSYWRALGTVLLGGILALFAGILVAVLVSVFSLGGANVILIVTLISVALGELFVAPLYAAFLVVLYYDLRSREQSSSADRKSERVGRRKNFRR
jgi:hypothetical protein